MAAGVGSGPSSVITTATVAATAVTTRTTQSRATCAPREKNTRTAMTYPSSRNPSDVGISQAAVIVSAAATGYTRRQASGTVDPTATTTESAGEAIGSTATWTSDSTRKQAARTTSFSGGRAGRDCDSGHEREG